jgi:hypothetical protein
VPRFIAKLATYAYPFVEWSNDRHRFVEHNVDITGLVQYPKEYNASDTDRVASIQNARQT